MKRSPRSPLGIIFLTIFLDLVGFGIVLPLLPYFAHQHQAQEWQIGLLMATYSLMQFFCAPMWGRLSDRIGRRPVLLFSISGSVVSYLLFAVAPNLTVLFLSRVLAGAMAANLGTAQAYVADVTKPEDRARGMGMVCAAFGLGFVFGPALAGGLGGLARASAMDPQWVIGLAAAAFSFIDLLLAARMLPESLTPEARRSATPPSDNRGARMLAALRDRRTGLPIGIFFLTTMAWSQLEPTLARLGQTRFAFDEAQTGYMFAFLGLVVALIQGGFAGRMARRSGEGRMIVFGTLTLGVGLLLVSQAVTTGSLYGALAVLGLGQACALPGLQSLISRSTAASEQGSTLGISQGFSSLARAAGPAIGGTLFGYRAEWPFLFGAALMLVAFTIAWSISARLRKASHQASQP